MNAELLPEEAQTSATRAAIQRDLIEMGRLIADLLESERLSSRHGALQCEAVDVAALAHEVVAHLNTESIFAGVAQARIKVVMAPNLPRMQLDPVRIRLLLRNLLDNALRYAAADAPPCELAVHCADKQLAITVRDYGPGVDATQLPHLMQAFYRPDASRQRSTGGVGLGLYLCQLVAHAHGGSLTLANASPGLLATIRLPVVT